MEKLRELMKEHQDKADKKVMFWSCFRESRDCLL